MTKLRSRQLGVRIILVLSAIGVVLLMGASGWLLWSNFGESTDNVSLDSASQKVDEKCEEKADKDICKFLASLKQNTDYRITSIMNNGAKSVFEIDGENTHMKSEGEYAYEVITIGKIVYTKAGDTWYKSIDDRYAGPAQVGTMNFDASTATIDDATSKMTYKLISKEACGNLQCFKYQIIDSDVPESINYIWFDDKEYKARRALSEYTDGKYEATYEYGSITVKAPAPVKELKPGDVVMPGASEPTSMLDMAE